MTGIYKITSPTGAINIGQSRDLARRKRHYKNLICKSQPKVYESILTYGWDSHTFEVIHQLPKDISQAILDHYETLYWKRYKDSGFEMLNIKEPTATGKHAEETKRKISQSLRNFIRTDEYRLKVSGNGNSMYGRKHSGKSKMRMRINSRIIRAKKLIEKLKTVS